MSYHWVTPLVAAIATLILAIVVDRKGPRTEVAKAFVFLSVMLTFWNLNFFVLYSVPSYELAFVLARTLRTGSLFVPPAVLHLVLLFDPNKSRLWKTILLVAYGVSCFVLVTNVFDAFIPKLHRFSLGYYSTGAWPYDIFSGETVCCFAAAGYSLIRSYRSSDDPRMRLQLRFWLLGAAIALPFGLTNIFPAYHIQVFPLGNIGEATFAGLVAYAIVRHRLMDIELVVTKGVAYAAVSLVLVLPLFLATLWLEKLSFGHVNQGFSLVLFLMLVLVGGGFPALRLRAESRIERSLFPGRFEDRSELAALARSIVRILDRDALLATLASTLGDSLHAERVTIFLADDSSRGFRAFPPEHIVPEIAVSFDDLFVPWLTRRASAVLRHELDALADPAGGRARAVFERYRWEVCVPLVIGKQLIGFIGLGRKRSLDAYSSGDLQLLETVGAEASVALENARLYAELKKSRDIIKRADRLSALGTLAAGIAHEIRNPLVSIQTFFQLAPQRLNDEEFLTSFLNLAASEVRRIANLVTELLSFARSPARSVEAVDPARTVERVVTLLQPEAKKHRLNLTYDCSADLPQVNADEDQVKQVLINLVLNAIQATKEGGAIAISARVLRRWDSAFVQVEVRDSGVGIPPDQIEHIFDPFFTTKDKSTGLGLAIAHQIATEHGGYLTVESNPGVGSSFFLNLPVALQLTDRQGLNG